jgi:regulatory protein
MLRQRSLSTEQALQKLRHFCSYQERCHQEVKEKLHSFGLRKQDVETAVATLIQEDRLNEERFAIQFAGGHFRLKNWGKIKIRYELRQKKVSDYWIQKALASIDEEAYTQTLITQAIREWETLDKEPDPRSCRRKLHDYLLQKGYESDRITTAIAIVAPA